MILRAAGFHKARRQPSSTWLLLLLAILMMAQIAIAQGTTTENSATTTDPATTRDSATTATTKDDTTTTAQTTAKSTTDNSKTTTTDAKSTASTTESSTSSTATNDYPVVTVPPLSNAPYMQTSDTPEGTIFIAVGAILGFFGLAVLAWRGMVAWSVNRSVRKAAILQSSEAKGLLRSRRKRSAHRSHGSVSVSMEKMGASHRGNYANPRASKAASSNSGLFFSPTAGVHSGGNRGSSYLPAGYYAAGSAAAGNGSRQSMQFSSPDLPGFGPQSQGYTRTKSGPSPPGTPTQAPGGVYEPQNNTSRYSQVASNSSVNVTSPTRGRTPSAYLEDLFENHTPQNRL
ncbi:hypothetical protein BDV28DRAFT_143048 [Aspergillus coremiiformis]|uniref:Uncharacterized protein n=1 Tax=Aspergillus coremiiformis TaxID=138285 RepID=A0A5N6YT30_9EURO|nr:hypothetical protein BDV28DRAFT_143048 [Aspergillus coremiiformis]